MIGLIKTDDRLYHFCGFADDADAAAKISEATFKVGVVAYECRDDGYYRILAGRGEYEREPYPAPAAKRLLPVA